MTADGGAAPETLDCPFCAEPIRPQAIVCKHCRRDVGIPMPLLLAQRAQAREIEALRCEVVELRAELLAARSSPGALGALANPDLPGAPGLGVAEPPAARPVVLLAGWALCLAGLLLLHALLQLHFDASVASLRAACIGWPLLVGLLLPGFSLIAPRWTVLLAASLGLVAVTGMSAMVARVDGTPVLPATARDLYEFLEFALSIGLAFAAGGLARRALRLGRERQLHRKAMAQARDALSRDGARRITDNAELLNKLIEASWPLLAILGAVIAGFRAIFGAA